MIYQKSKVKRLVDGPGLYSNQLHLLPITRIMGSRIERDVVPASDFGVGLSAEQVSDWARLLTKPVFTNLHGSGDCEELPTYGNMSQENVELFNTNYSRQVGLNGTVRSKDCDYLPDALPIYTRETYNNKSSIFSIDLIVNNTILLTPGKDFIIAEQHRAMFYTSLFTKIAYRYGVIRASRILHGRLLNRYLRHRKIN